MQAAKHQPSRQKCGTNYQRGNKKIREGIRMQQGRNVNERAIHEERRGDDECADNHGREQVLYISHLAEPKAQGRLR